MENLLLPLLNAGDERERQQRLEELLSIHVAPIIRQVLRQRLGFYVSAQGVNENHNDAEDLYQDAMTRIVEVLHDWQFLITIKNFDRYVARIVSNICADFLRTKYPARTRLKNSLRDVFRRRADLVSWRDGDEIVCGFAAWRDTGKQAIDVAVTELNAFPASRFADEDVRVVPLSRVVSELIEWLGGPVQMDVLVGMLAYVRDMREQRTESLDDDLGTEFEVDFRSTESDVEAHELLERLWHIVKRLTPKQRDVFALGFQDHAGRNLFTVLLAAGIADYKDLADGMGRSVGELARLWTQMPMDSATIATELRATRENVYKWRSGAIQKLRAELE